MSPGPSEVDKALIQKLEVQNFQNASDNSQRLQQKLVNEKKHEIDQRNKAEEQNRKNKFRIPKMNGNQAKNNEWELWGTALKDWKDFSKKNSKKTLQMILRGIPSPLRPMAWQTISGADLRLHQRYSDLLSQETNSEKMIRGDISRTFPEEELFKANNGTEMLFNVMKAYAVSDPEVGYCQGSAFIAGMLLLHMPEEDAFSVLVKLLSKGTGYGLREMYKPGMGELPILLYQLDQLILEHASELHNHFKAHEFSTATFASKWFLTLFCSVFPKALAVRILDIFFVDGIKVIFRCGLALLLTLKDQFLGRDMDGMMSLAQKEAPKFFARDPDLLINKAYSSNIKISDSKLSKWRKEAESERKRELAEEGEVRRLRAENRILSNRIQSLEKENNTLAHNLIQRSVKQAIEAEEKILLGKELKLAKKHVKRLSGSGSDIVTEETVVTFSEEFVLELQQELVKARLREAEATVQLKETNERLLLVELENRELRKDNQLEEALFEATQAKKLEAEAVAALKELQIGLQANLNKDAISSDSALEAMVSAAASARANLIESKQQINILEAHSKRLSQERESLSSQVTLLKDRLTQLQKDYDRKSDDLLREKTLRQSELAQIKIDQLEQNLDSVERSARNSLNGTEVPQEIPQMKESDLDVTSSDPAQDDPDQDDLDQLTLKIDSTDQN